MRKIIYIGFVGFLFVMGFLNLDGNDWKPVELPEFTTSFFETGERILPKEKWEENLTGTWEYTTQINQVLFKGTISYNPDKTFVRKGSYRWKTKDEDIKSGGTVRGIWGASDNNTWFEKIEKCKFEPNQNVCDYYTGTITYGAVDSDIWDYKVIYFNASRIEIRAEHLAGDDYQVFKFTRAD